MNWNHKLCVDCARTMSADDAHKRCQKCRHGGKWRMSPLVLTGEQRRRYNAKRRQEYARLLQEAKQ